MTRMPGGVLESSAGQIERLDWLAQNLLELSKLDSGLVAPGPAPDDLPRCHRIGGASARAAAARRGCASRWNCRCPDPDPTRPSADRPGRRQPRRQCGEVHPRGGSVHVAVEATDDEPGRRLGHGGRHRAAELPHISSVLSRLPRQRGARHRSGLGSRSCGRSWTALRDGVVESGADLGSRFTVHLPRDPTLGGWPRPPSRRMSPARPRVERIAAAAADGGTQHEAPEGAPGANVTETSPSDASGLNPSTAP